MIKVGSRLVLALTLTWATTDCGGGAARSDAGGAGAGGGGSGGVAAQPDGGGGGVGIGPAGTAGGAGAGGAGGATASAGAAGSSGGAGGSSQAAGSGGADASAGVDATAGSTGGVVVVDMLPSGYKGTPFAALTIPGRINAADYDRGGAGVAWCHDMGACGSGTTTGDWYPAGSAPYRPPIPATAKVCSGAACDDNVGVCRMSPNKPDRTSATELAPAADTYLCYSVAGEWTKYTVLVTQAGTYAVGGFMAVPQGGGVSLSFGGTITTGNLTLAVTNPSNCGGGEYFHCWAQRENLATVTFPAAGTYLMTLTQTGRFNADNFTFTKM
jgi:hypothetical protein